MSHGIPTRVRPLAHEHSAGDITSGVLADARIQPSNVLQHAALVEHGALSGLDDDDHPQYALADGTRWTAAPFGNRVVVSDVDGALTASDVTRDELACLAGVASEVQTQLDGKASAAHTHALEELANVSGSPVEGDVLQFDAGSATWQPASAASATALSELSDVDLASLASGDLLQFNGGSWVNVAAAFVSSAGISAPMSGQFLKFVDGAWTNAAIASADVTFGDIATDIVTGLRLATSAVQKLGFWGATPIVQPAGADQSEVTLGSLDLDIGSLTFGASYNPIELEALRDNCEELADDVRALAALVHALRAALVACGVIKGSL